jgi:hypothetical protein
MIRGKFVVDHVVNHQGNYAHVVLDARYDSSLPEDQRFAEATPNGKIEMSVTVPSVIEAFQPGKVFYVDFTEAPAGTPQHHQ